MEYEIVVEYRRRRTIEIQVKPEGMVRVLAPAGIGSQVVENFVDKKHTWIVQKLGEFEQIKKYPRLRFQDGDTLYVRGKPYRLRLVGKPMTSSIRVRQRADEIVVESSPLSDEQVKALLEQWYRREALDMAQTRVAHFCPSFRKQPQQVKISAAQKRWGSCSARGNLNFTWRCIMLPDEVFDYIVVHELSHLIHFDHSQAFWQLVAAIMPDYQRHVQWLKTNGLALSLRW